MKNPDSKVFGRIIDKAPMRRLLAIFMSTIAVSSLVACDAAEAPPEPSPISDVQEQIAATVAFKRSIDESGLDVSEARGQITDPTNTGIVSSAGWAKFIDSAVAFEILADRNSNKAESVAANSITDPHTRALLAKLADFEIANDAVDHAGFDPSEANEILDEMNSAGIREKAKELVGATIGIDAFGTADFDTKGARKELNYIPDNEQKMAIRRLVEIAIAYNKLYFGKSEHAVFNNIKDPKLKKELQQILTAEGTLAASARLRDLYFHAIGKVYNIERRASNVFNNAETNVWDKITDGYDQQGDAIYDGISQHTSQYNGIDSVPRINVKGITDPNGTIDLFSASGENQVAAATGDADTDGITDTSYGVFAQLYSQDGDITIDYSDGDSLLLDSKAALEEVIESVSPLIKAAMAEGTLLGISFIVDKEADPYYSPAERMIYVSLEGNNVVTKKQLAALLSHEISHALFEPLFSKNGDLVTEKTKQLLAVCTVIRDSVNDTIEQESALFGQYLDALISRVKTKHKPVFMEAKAALDSRKLSEHTNTSDKYNDINYNNCDPVTFQDYVMSVARKMGINISENSYNEYFDIPEYGLASDLWRVLVRDKSVFSAFNEAGYLTIEDPNKMSYGHTEDGADELLGSVMDLLLNYYPQYIEKINNASGSKKNAMLKATFAILAFAGENPHLAKWASQMESAIRKDTSTAPELRGKSSQQFRGFH